MKKLLLIFIALIFSNIALSAQTCQWAERIGGLYDDIANSTCVDASGNVYVAGCFKSSTLPFNNGISLTNSGYLYDAYIAKYNSSGICQWAQKFSGKEDDYAKSISVDGSGNVYVAGSFASTILSFNNGITLTNADSMTTEAYIAKYNSNGICQWAQKIGGTSYEFAFSINIDASGNVYVAGDFDAPTLLFNNGITLTNSDSGSFDAYIAKYNSNGICQWAQKIGGIGFDVSYSISLDASGNIYMAGYFMSSTLYFNNGISLINSDSLDGYIAKYNASGICQWAEKIGGTGTEFALSIIVVASENVYVAGYSSSTTLSFNNGISLTNSGGNDAYISKYNSNGICQWAEKIGGTYNDRAFSLSVDASENIFVAGYFQSSSLSLNNGITINNSGEADVYITKYNSSGICQWAHKIGGANDEHTYSISVDSSGNIFVAGDFSSPNLSFNNGLELTNSGGYDTFIAKYSNTPNSVTEEIPISISTSPNPASEDMTLTYSLANGGEYSIALYNSIGELIKIVSQGIKDAGEYNEKIDIS